MTLRLGARLGPFEIIAPLGAGGMGEVWKARDTRLDRLVAVKVLPDHLSKDPESLARFEREAKAVAALNHPNILGIFDIGIQEGTHYAVMELLEGETLHDRLGHGPIPVRRAVEFAIQMANALAGAHSRGIIHRDLKPDNLWITKDGRLKILDFGLAKQTAAQASGSNSMTEAVQIGQVHHTEKGTVLGTVGYMSPEQVRGEAVGARSDIFSFGAVFYEMLTGKRAFTRDSASETLAAILRDDPPEIGSSSTRALSLGLRRILDHCLDKDINQRFHDAQDLAFALESALDDSGNPSARVLPAIRTPMAQRLPMLGAFMAGGLLVGGLLALLRPASSQASSPVAVRFLTNSGRDTSPAASPDGRTLAFTSHRDGQARIWLKQLRGGGEVALTAGADDFARFSPDGSSILFIRSEGKGSSLFRTSTLGTSIYKIVGDAVHADWSPDGNRIAYLRSRTESGTVTSSLMLIGSGGGPEKELARFPAEFLAALRWSPDGKHIALTPGSTVSGGQSPKIFLVRVQDGVKTTFPAAARFGIISFPAWMSPEEILYFQAESVAGNGVGTSSSRAYRHNIRTGKSVPMFWAPVTPTCLDLVAGGKVVFDGIAGRQNLRSYPLNGTSSPTWLTRGNINDRQPVFSPEGGWVVFSSNRSGNLDLWAVSTRTGILKSLTDDAAEDWDPGFSPDGTQLLWSSNRSGSFEIWMANADGSGARQVSQDGVDAENPTQTRDGRWVVYISGNPKHPGLWKIHPDGTGAALLAGGTNFIIPEVSPDGRYVLYTSVGDSLIATLHVLRVEDGADVGFQSQVEPVRKTTTTLGRGRWTPDGRQILFTGQDERGYEGVFVQDFVPGKDTRASRKPLAGFDPDWITESLGLSPDGTRLVLSESERMFCLLVAEGLSGAPYPLN